MDGFRTKPLIAALDKLAARSPSKPLGLVLGSGLEDKLRLIEFLSNRYRLLGCAAETIQGCKDPQRFFAAVKAAGIPFPETRRDAPADPHGWLSKRIGGSGGRHIRICRDGAHTRARPRRYFQRRLDGERISVGVLAMARGTTFALTRQWCAPTDHQPFRYGGAVRIPFDNESTVHRLLCSYTARLIEPLKLKGMASFDYIVTGGTPHLLEVNPRPGAALDVLDDANGAQFAAHVAASLGSNDQPPAAEKGSRAAAILHADRAAVTLGDICWPNWSADRGAEGTSVPGGAPLATVFADAQTPDEAEQTARARLAELADLIYEQENAKQKRSAR